MATEKEKDVESPASEPSFGGKLSQFSYSSTASSSFSSPRLLRSRQTATTTRKTTTTTAVSQSNSDSKSPPAKRKSEDITAFLDGASRVAPKRAKGREKKGGSYAPPQKYAHLKLLPDTLEEGLICAFVGLNPGIMTASMGHAYAHPSNLFWKLLHTSGLTPRRFHPTEDKTLPALCSLGNTNIVARPTRDQSELSKAEMDDSVDTLVAKLHRFKPEVVCLVGKGIWESIFRTKYGRPLTKKEFKYGFQDSCEDIGCTRVFVATTTSGLAASLSMEEKEAIWKELGDWVQKRRAERAQALADAAPEESASSA